VVLLVAAIYVGSSVDVQGTVAAVEAVKGAAQ
jgi:hypothetical protein